MNVLSLEDLEKRLVHRLKFRIRRLRVRRRVRGFSSGGAGDALGRIYVINLDRRPDRWKRVRRELGRFHDRHGEPLTSITRRFSAIDARYMQGSPDPSILVPSFTLAEQLEVDPNPLLKIDDDARALTIPLTRPEIAVASSHIEVWRLIADGDVPSALILEDDVFMPLGFARNFDAAWSALRSEGELDFDLLYLSFKEVGEKSDRRDKHPVHVPRGGLWEASGYVLSKEGAKKLLARLPVKGPVDLWLNQQFDDLRVLTSRRRLFEQRADEPSSNSYSVLPVLSQVGVITREKPLVQSNMRLQAPIVAVGAPGSGLTSLATALSMLGYTCLSDMTTLPGPEQHRLRSGRGKRVFNAYVNIDSLDDSAILEILNNNKSARLVTTSPTQLQRKLHSERVLDLSLAPDRWAALSEFLNLDYPSWPYPDDVDLGHRLTTEPETMSPTNDERNLKFDRSPWIAKANSSWKGLAVEEEPDLLSERHSRDWSAGQGLDDAVWRLRHDTFPSNLAFFRPANFSMSSAGDAVLTLTDDASAVRSFMSAAIASHGSFTYGSFRAVLKPAAGPGLITGMFLHRNGPRQEIDVEILGRDTTKMLVNVFFNPGPLGTRLEYGYRGTPTLIDLGFDASEDFHEYEIEWMPDFIRWRVDGELVYERLLWGPTPIPDQPLEFNINLWTSRSTEFCGRMVASDLPARTAVRSINVEAHHVEARVEGSSYSPS